MEKGENSHTLLRVVACTLVDGLTLMHIWAALIRLEELVITKIFKGKHETEIVMRWVN